jgi:hypothetical protein
MEVAFPRCAARGEDTTYFHAGDVLQLLHGGFYFPELDDIPLLQPGKVPFGNGGL